MHNPKPSPSVRRPPAPPSPQNPSLIENVTEEKYITRLDTDKPGLYIVKLLTLISKSRTESLFQELHKKINVFAPGSELVILPPYVEVVEIQNKVEPEPSDAWMNERVGEKETIPFSEWLPIEDAPRDRYILVRDSGEYHVVQWNSNVNDWVDEEGVWYSASEWMELPK